MYKQIRCKSNDLFRNSEVSRIIQELAASKQGNAVLLDVGAGLSPFRKCAQDSQWIYRSHDFGKYTPNLVTFPGLQSDLWPYPQHDFACDILDIPSNQKFELILCTEVLEHVPNPIAAFEKLSQLTLPGGNILITVPFASLMHQAPYWYQSGLSPYWFEYWSEKYGIEIVELTVYGDYLDVLSQEFRRIMRMNSNLLSKLLDLLFCIWRPFTKKQLLESWGFGVIFLGRMPKNIT